ncbi:DUF302 domain-containing protein [Falsiroseomonas tokyonensis]|uniref:DUF302 domain-containing protein n=1 Tax=Falsiroseomonas tokyonensis TaxID=430521 RepID=A0ABV7BN91_9PROT|nr:DUF302 domain-containing protein [Falsiroseomonas tokyonensis]MBU8536305.1 DUF302 domain-containing protein [Falsiroseomonas tokyonensis]
MRIARRGFPGIAALLLLLAPQAVAQSDDGLVTVPSRHSPAETLSRFEAAVRAAGWVVFTRIDHAAAAREVGMELAPRTVLLFGNPRAGTPGMAATPTLALDLPLRVLVWQDAAGQTFLTRSSGSDLARRLFGRHGVTVPEQGQAATEAFLANLARQATE